MPEPVIIVGYDPTWPILYEVERTHILKAISGFIEAVLAKAT